MDPDPATKDSGFMDSYMKFLQTDGNSITDSDIGLDFAGSTNGSSHCMKHLPVVKTSKDSSNEGTNNTEEVAVNVTQNADSTCQEMQEAAISDESATNALSVKTGSKRKKPLMKRKEEVSPNLSLPRRESARRQAKEKVVVNQGVELEDEEAVDDPDFLDSDSDPAWTPAAKNGSDDDGNRRGLRRTMPFFKKFRSRSRGTNKNGDSTSDSDDEPLVRRGRPKEKKVIATPTVARDEVNEEASAKKPAEECDVAQEADENAPTYRSGEFVVLKADLVQETPPIWRIDGKMLLQKYLPFKENGLTLYENISTYSGWMSQMRHKYQPVAVKFRVQNRNKTIVEAVFDKPFVISQELIDKTVKETEKYHDNFQIYIQTLISQSFDSNFLSEILRENDEFFLSNVKTLDDLVEERKQRLFLVVKWTGSFKTSVETWPNINIIPAVAAQESKGKLCAACSKECVRLVEIELNGNPYEIATLKPRELVDEESKNQKAFSICSLCVDRVKLYNKVTHQKYLMFCECDKRVSEMRGEVTPKEMNVILNELLADELWFNKLFLSVRSSWAEIDIIYENSIPKVPSTTE